MGNIQFQDAKQRIQRKLGIAYYHAVVGDADGLIYADDGNVWVRIWQSGGLSAPKSVRNKAQVQLAPSTAVWLSYDLDNRLVIVSPDVDGMLAQGANPYLNNAVDQTFTGFSDQTQLTTGLAFTPSPTTNEITVNPWIFYDRSTLRFFSGDRISLTSYTPLAGFQCLACVFITINDTLEVIVSTDRNLADVITLETDLAECFDNRTPGSIPNSAWLLRDGVTTVNNNDDGTNNYRWLDLRGILNVDDGNSNSDDPEVINTAFLVPNGRVKMMYNPSIGTYGTLQVTGTLKLI